MLSCAWLQSLGNHGGKMPFVSSIQSFINIYLWDMILFSYKTLFVDVKWNPFCFHIPQSTLNLYLASRDLSIIGDTASFNTSKDKPVIIILQPNLIYKLQKEQTKPKVRRNP